MSIFLSSSFSQTLTKLQFNTLSQKEDSLKIDAYKIINSLNAEQRFRADSQFTRIFVRALKIPFSFNYPFDSLFQISKLYSPDSNFRIFTWQVSRDEEMHRRHGAIQMKTKDGSLKLFPLIDRSFLISNQKDTITNNEWWIGAIYYKIIKKEFKGKSFYTLLGYDENTLSSTKKRIEVLKFDENVLPVFGGDYFAFQKDTIPKASQSRFWIEFKKNGNGRIFYDNELDMIIYDHQFPFFKCRI